MKSIAICTCVGLSAMALSATKLNFCYENIENFPYYTKEGREPPAVNPGVTVELIKSLETQLDVVVIFDRQPWLRCQSSLEQGDFDGIFNASYKPERRKLGRYPMLDADTPNPKKRLTTISYFLYKHKLSILGWDGKSFSNLEGAIGAPRGYSIVDELQAKGVQVDTTNSTLMDLRKATERRITGVAALEPSADHYINKNKEFSQIIKVQPPLVSKPYYLMLSHELCRRNEKLCIEIWDAIERLRERNFETIMNKYLES